MTPLPGTTPPAQRYLESISLDCGNPSMVLRTVLDFYMMLLPGGQGAMVDYWRPTDQSQGGDGRVTVDEGSIEVRQVDNQVCIRTTKRVQFSYGFTAGELAMISCALGYGALGEELIFSCARQSEGRSNFPYRGVPMPSGKGTPESTPEPIGAIIADGVKALGDCLNGCAASARCAGAKLRAGTYGPADAAADLTETGTRMLRDFSAAASLSARTMRATQSGVGRSNAGSEEEVVDR
jgi:hypothetical protein